MKRTSKKVARKTVKRAAKKTARKVTRKTTGYGVFLQGYRSLRSVSFPGRYTRAEARRWAQTKPSTYFTRPLS